MKKNNDNMGFFKNKKGDWSVIQFPNFILIAWLVLTIALLFIPGGALKNSVQQLSSAVLFTWAYLEVTKGDSQFRQLFGGVVLFSVIYSFFT